MIIYYRGTYQMGVRQPYAWCGGLQFERFIMSIRDQWLSTVPRREDLMFPIEQSFNKFFDDFFSSNPLSKVKANAGYPRMNAYETDDKFVIALSVPGMKKDDINIEINSNHMLTVEGKMSEDYQAPDDAGYYLRELRQSSFSRSVQLPEHAQGDPQAVMKDGILELTWHIFTKKPDPVRKITIKTEDGS